mgnify:CR=1 FL=1
MDRRRFLKSSLLVPAAAAAPFAAIQRFMDRDGPSVVGDPSSMTTITLLAAYTEAAAAESADIVSEINLAVSMANTAYANSGVNITLQLTGTIAATYTESSKDASTVITDARLGMAGSGDLSELQAARIA